MKLRDGDDSGTMTEASSADGEPPSIKATAKKNKQLDALKRNLTRMTDNLAAEIEKVGSPTVLALTEHLGRFKVG